ncbi:hypothetical protein VTK73DRAFT_5449 [Phialemonium thermophilum]|uniref:Mediator of RNA polymerase II transcription subunit 16 n=1 Tax=Phialemonium thermophilum TaxID=223376 RepID=A0ABR3WP52_9PEZI
MDVEMDVNMDNALGGMESIDNTMQHNFDLFGDPLRPTTASKQLLQRLDELRARGCCQGIAWSRQGTIASISQDGQSIELRFLRSNPSDGSWDLSEPTPCVALSNAIPGCPITHLLWASTSNAELAVIDSVGRVTILSFSVTLNRPSVLRRWDADLVDDLHAVVGCYWLPPVPQSKQASSNFPCHFMYAAVRDGNNYKYENPVVPAFGPWHPNPGRSALLCLTTGGLLKLFFYQSNSRIEETTLDLERVASSDDLITHASICSDRNSLLIALATASKQLKVIRATIQWNAPPASGEKQNHMAGVPLNPTLREMRIAVTSWFQYEPGQSHLDSSMSELSHIEVLPSALETFMSTVSQPLSPPVVLTVRSYAVAEHSAYNQEPQSVVDRWEILSDNQQGLHPAFEQISQKGATSSTSQPMQRLRKLDSIIIPKIIIAVHTMHLGRVICFAFSDGTTQYRDRITMNEIYNEPNFDRIMALQQAGFGFEDEIPCLQVAFSPTSSSFVQICEDGKVRWNSMKYLSEDQAQHAAIVAALGVTISSAAVKQASYDDILAVARPFAAKNNRFPYDLITEIVRILKVVVDYSDDSLHDQLVRNSNLLMCLSILNHLGFQGEFQPRPFSGKFAMLALGLRNIVILITIASNAPVHLNKMNPMDEPEVIDILAGCVKWVVQLLAWLTDCLFNLLDDEEFMTIVRDRTRFSELTPYLQSRGDVSLHLLLCSSTRGFLLVACRRLLQHEVVSNRAIHYYETRAAMLQGPDASDSGLRNSSAIYHAYLKMQHVISGSAVKVGAFDKLLAALVQEIRTVYQEKLPVLANQGKQQQQPQPNGQQALQQGASGGATDATRRAQAQCELSLLMAAAPPSIFQEVLVNFFDKHLRSFRTHTDPAKLFFGNYDLLEVEDDERSLAEKRKLGRRVDVFKRSELFLWQQQQQQQQTPVPPGGGAGRPNASNGQVANNHHHQVAGGGGGSTNGAGLESTKGQLRRCVRCAAVMENVVGQRPGFTFVLGQQRKCACGGNWGMLPVGSLVN